MTNFRRSSLWSSMVCAGLLALASCGGAGDSMSRTFGLTQREPDEFTVTTRAPLSMPPDFSLRPPEPGMPRPQEQTPTQTAEATVDPQAVLAQPQSGNDSPGQDALLQAAGAPAPADIRETVNAEAVRDSQKHALADELMFWKDPTPPPGVVVDAQKEAERLRQDSALGKSPDTGDTPVISTKKKSLLDELF